MDRLKGKVAIVTGGTSGIGRACVLRFAEEGARIVVAARRREIGTGLAASLGHNAMFVATDVLREEDIQTLIDRVLDRFGQIDCFVSNAGSGSATVSIAKTSADALDHDLALHLRAPFLAMKYASPAMVSRGSGSFINMSSISAHRAGFNTFGYEVAKAALVHLTRCAAIELGEKGVRVNSISPGPTLTGIFVKESGMNHDSADHRTHEIETAFRGLLSPLQPLPGMIHAEDIASAAAFLASDEARYINGHDLTIDGGITAGRPASTMAATWQALREALRAAGAYA
jgi:NAD(P)-dependent dehydrogenase (short-subunit alcohol dehydrogenase family)